MINIYRNYPESIIKMNEGELAEMVSKIINQEADLGFDFVTEQELNGFDSAQITFFVLQKRPLYVYVSRQSPLPATAKAKAVAKTEIITVALPKPAAN